MTWRDVGRNTAYRVLSAFDLATPAPVVLLYHSVGSAHAASVPAATFDRHMARLRARFTIVPLADLPRALAERRIAGRLASVTFDDGYRDNHDRALPVLERHGIVATFFVATGFVGRTFRGWAGEHPMMTAAELRDIAARGHAVGAHGVSHVKLTRVPAPDVEHEVRASKTWLEDCLGRPVDAFAYPKGAHDDLVRRIVASAGFRLAATTREAVVDGAPDWLALPRLVMHPSLRGAAFDAKLSRAAQWYHGWRRPRSAA